MLPWKLRKCQILPVNQNLSSVYFSYAKFQLVSCDPSLAIIWQMTYTHKLPKLCSATLSNDARVRTVKFFNRRDQFDLRPKELQILKKGDWLKTKLNRGAFVTFFP